MGQRSFKRQFLDNKTSKATTSEGGQRAALRDFGRERRLSDDSEPEVYKPLKQFFIDYLMNKSMIRNVKGYLAQSEHLLAEEFRMKVDSIPNVGQTDAGGTDAKMETEIRLKLKLLGVHQKK